MQNFLNKKLSKQTFLTRFLISFVLFLVLFLITNTPKVLWQQLLLATAISFWFTFLTDFLIFKYIGKTSYAGPLLIKKIAINKDSIAVSSSLLKRIPNIKIDYSRILNDNKTYAVAFLIAPHSYIVLDILDGTEGTYCHEIYSDILLAAFKESKKALITTHNKEIILTFLEIPSNTNVLDKVISQNILIEYNLKYPYIKY